jgi:methionyl aminopeptidase
VAVGAISDAAAHLIASTRTAMLRGIAACGPGRRYSEVGTAVEAAIAEANQGSNDSGKHGGARDGVAVQLRVVPGFCGHGIGREFHAAPNVIHYARSAKYTQRKVSQLDFPVSSLRLRPGAPVPPAAELEYEEYVKCIECGASTDAEMRPGHVFTIEPIVSAGSCVAFEWEEDGWTQTTMDGSIAAQFEHTVLVTDSGVSVLTQ